MFLSMSPGLAQPTSHADAVLWLLQGGDSVPFAPSVVQPIHALLEIFGNLSLFSLFSPTL